MTWSTALFAELPGGGLSATSATGGGACLTSAAKPSRFKAAGADKDL